MPWIVLLAASYLAKRKLLAQWDAADRTRSIDSTYASTSRLVALAIPWDLTVGLLTPGRNVLFGNRKKSSS